MLQSSMQPQLARLKIKKFLLPKIPGLVTAGTRTRTEGLLLPTNLGPVKYYLCSARKMLKYVNHNDKHWLCKGMGSVAIAVELLRADKIIAIPTDTVYGLAGLVESNSSIESIYKIKNRDENKPLAISVSSVDDIGTWGKIDHLPAGLLETILPGPFTVILKRTSALNPALNPNNDDVAIRVPEGGFINCVTKITGPLALTSANVSNQPSAIHPDEFSELWPLLGGIFYDTVEKNVTSKNKRIGSTIVDLSQHGEFKIVRFGIKAYKLVQILGRFKLEWVRSNTES